MENVSKLTLIFEFCPFSQISPSGDFQIKMGDAGLTPFAVAPLPIGGHFKESVRERVERVVQCVNAMYGIEDPKKLRETYEACKELELDKYQKLKGFLSELISDIHVGYDLTSDSQRFKELENLIK